MKFAKELVLVAVALMVAALSVQADPVAPDGATLTIGDSQTYSGGSTSAVGVNASGGNYTYLNASASIQTDNWQIFYGTVQGDLVLQDASANAAYSWSPQSSVSGLIFFSNQSSVTWSGLTGSDLNVAQLQQENSQLGLGSANDNITETLSATPVHGAINFTGFGGIDPGDTSALTTNNGSSGAEWNTAYTWQGSAQIYIGFINSTTKSAFNGDAANYQVMVPTSNGGVRQYWVFLALE